MVQPHFNYCSVAWYGRFKEDCVKLTVIQKRRIRIILSADYYTPLDSMFSELGWKCLSDRNFQSAHGFAPQYLTRKFKYIRGNHNSNTRQAAAGQLALPPLTHGYDIECFFFFFFFFFFLCQSISRH